MQKQAISLKRLLAVMMILVLMSALALSGCGNNGGTIGGDTVKYGVWVINGEDTTYYPTYDKNPGIEYLTSLTWGPDKKKVSLEFFVPVSGQQADNFNTLLSTGDYPEMMDATMYTGSIVDLYEQGIILDLTALVDQHMPNYKAFLAAHPDLAQAATYVVNGEKKYLTVRNFRDAPPFNWGGYQYRRDWIIKYGKNPKDGSAFSGSHTDKLADGSDNKNSWQDNVIFPSGGSDPVTISDWEWMLDIFKTAIEDLGIEDGYPMSLYYPGYLATGDLVSSFGGGSNGGAWYKHSDGTIHFGGDEDDFRVYLQAMNTWYSNGWIDKSFTEHSSDMFYKIEDAKVRSGKIGLWYGVQNQLMGNLDDGEDLKAGMMVYAARQPINDKYGSSAQQNVEPYTIYQLGLEGNNWIITDKAEEKDIVPLLTMMDYMFSEEGSIMGTMGLNKAQYDATKNELYTRLNLTEGAYIRIPEDQVRGTRIYRWVDTILFDGGTLQSACKPNRFFFLDRTTISLPGGTDSFIGNLEQWIYYENKGTLTGAVLNQVSPEEQKIVAKTQTNVNEFMAKSVPPFIKGEKDPFSDEDWTNFVKALNKYNPAKVTAIYQQKLDNLD